MSVTSAHDVRAERARRALRRVASGVSVLTVDHAGVRRGATVSALVAVSREPLIVALCLRVSSSFAELVRHAGCFSVNVLAASQAPLARRFADRTRPPGDAQFAGLRWTRDPFTAAPLIDGCLAHLACRFAGTHRVGDHDLITAEVIGGDPAPTDANPLLAFAGQLLQPVHAVREETRVS